MARMTGLGRLAMEGVVVARTARPDGLVQGFRLPDRAVFGSYDLADAGKREMFRIKALTGLGGVADERNSGRGPQLLVAVERY
jgi:hypothetical protein